MINLPWQFLIDKEIILCNCRDENVLIPLMDEL